MIDLERDAGRVQAVVPRGVQLDAGLDVLLGDAGERQERRDGGHGREAAPRPYLHRRAHRNLRLGAAGRRDSSSGTRGEPHPHLEGHAVSGGVNLEVGTPREGARLDRS